MDEKELIEEAIKRLENGESPKEIYQSLGKSKAWFFKRLKRYKHEGENWLIADREDLITLLKRLIQQWNKL